jgi:hypothetical protein
MPFLVQGRIDDHTLAVRRCRLHHQPVYVNTSKQVGDKDHLKVIANEIAAEEWFSENDPEGVAFEYPVSDRQ